MVRPFPLFVTSIALLGLCGIGIAAHNARQSDLPIAEITSTNAAHFELKEQDAAGLCPWRNRDEDLYRLFPDADSAEETSLVVSSQRLAMSKRLGRAATGDESALRAYRVMRGKMPCGTVIARRVRGEFGLIELIIGVDFNSNTVKAAEIQRIREPEPAASALQSRAWLDRFRGLSGDSDWKNLAHASSLPASAYVSAEAITDAARTAMILLDTAQKIHSAVPAASR